MKIGFSKIAASAVLTAGLVSMSATGAFAKPGNGGGGGGGGGNVAVCVDNLFAGLTTDCKAQSGNDDKAAIESLFSLNVIDGWNLDDYKVDSHSGSNNFFNVENIVENGKTDKTRGTVSFFDDTLKNSTFAFVLKGGNGHAAYLFDGINQLDNLNWETGSKADLSHATLYVFDKPASNDDVSQEVPEPATLLGLIAVGGMLVGKKGLSRNS